MKPLSFAPFALLVALSVCRAAEAPLPSFESSKIGHPPLSLGEAVRAGTLPQNFAGAGWRFDDPATPPLLGRPREPKVPAAPPKRFTQKSSPGRMPVLEPDPSIDHKIVIKRPDPRIDFKMLIPPSDPAEESAPPPAAADSAK